MTAFNLAKSLIHINKDIFPFSELPSNIRTMYLLVFPWLFFQFGIPEQKNIGNTSKTNKNIDCFRAVVHLASVSGLYLCRSRRGLIINSMIRRQKLGRGKRNR